MRRLRSGRWPRDPRLLGLLLACSLALAGALAVRTYHALQALRRAAELRDLERRDIVVRTVREQGEPHVDYALSPFGRTLRPVLTVMAEWARAHHRRLGATIATKGAGLVRRSTHSHRV